MAGIDNVAPVNLSVNCSASCVRAWAGLRVTAVWGLNLIGKASAWAG
jgi:hypothetical protein